MVDKKISALTGATTPLAGTEVLPIVQGGSTVKVSVANLTAGRAVAMAGGSFTDNITQSTAAKGVNFTANTPAAGMTSQLLNWYEEGTFTPVITYSSPGVGLTITYVAGSQKGFYIKIGNTVNVMIDLRINTFVKGTASGFVQVTGLPFTAKDTGAFGRAIGSIALSGAAFTGIPQVVVNSAATSMTLLQSSGGGSQTSISDPANGSAYYISATYQV